MTHPAVDRARELAADRWVENDSSFRNALTELVEAYEALQTNYDEELLTATALREMNYDLREECDRVVALNTRLTDAVRAALPDNLIAWVLECGCENNREHCDQCDARRKVRTLLSERGEV